MRRARLLLLLLAIGLLGCPDYGLESRRYVCSKAADCGSGWQCLDGFCARGADGGVPEACGNGRDDDEDGFVDCRDSDCGLASCDDENPCTSEACMGNGSCLIEAVADDMPCGAGCLCAAGEPTEQACGDRIDNDDDGFIDCLDGDCPGCMGGTTCCATGICGAVCM